MAKKVWTFELEDGPHTVELEHGYWSGKRAIRVDGKLLEQTANVRHAVMDTGGDDPFQIDGHTGTVRIQTNGLTYSYDLVLDGRSLASGKPATRRPPIPGWAWLFIVACGLIPVVTLGGALPGAIGGGGAFACARIARNVSESTGMRVTLCILVTMLCWLLLLILNVATVVLQARA